jgi:hypothetical protein
MAGLLIAVPGMALSRRGRSRSASAAEAPAQGDAQEAADAPLGI